jgi:hypothetical protein
MISSGTNTSLFRVSHNRNTLPHSLNMVKDGPLDNIAITSNHDGPRKTREKSKHGTSSLNSSDDGGFKVSPTGLILEIGHLTAVPALYQPTRHQQLWIHTPIIMGGCCPLIPTCMAEWRSGRACLGIYDRWHWLYPCCYSFGRDGLYVSELSLLVPFKVAHCAIGILL